MAIDNGVLHAIEGFAHGVLPDTQLFERCINTAHARLDEVQASHPEMDLSLGKNLVERLDALGSGAFYTRFVGEHRNAAMFEDSQVDKRIELTEDQPVLEELLKLNHSPAEARIFSMALLAEYGGIDTVISAPNNRLKMIAGVDERLLELLSLLRAIRTRAILEQSTHQKAIRTTEDIFDYCVSAMAHLEVAQLRIIYLDRYKHLIGIEVLQRGDFQGVAFFAGDIMRRAVELSARFVIVVQNQPLGAEDPDYQNMSEIFKLAKFGDSIDVELVDYILVSPFICFSFNEFTRVDETGRFRLEFEPGNQALLEDE